MITRLPGRVFFIGLLFPVLENFPAEGEIIAISDCKFLLFSALPFGTAIESFGTD